MERKWAAVGPRSQHLAWHEEVGIFTTSCSFPRAARRYGARSVGKVGRDRSPVAALGMARVGREFHRVLLVSTRCTPARCAVRGESGPRPVPGRSAWLGTKGLGFPPRLARFHALHAGTARGPWGKWAATGPRSQRLAWHDGVGISTRSCSFPRAACRDGALSVGKVGRDRSPVAALGMAGWGWDFHQVLLVSTRCTPGRRTVRGEQRPPKSDAHWVHEPAPPRFRETSFHILHHHQRELRRAALTRLACSGVACTRGGLRDFGH